MSINFKKLFPLMLEHQGVWVGNYTHLDMDGKLLDSYRSRVECVFPQEGDVVYLQKNEYTWPDGKTIKSEFGGVVKDDKIYWDTDTFHGYGWESENCVLLTLDRKDDPGTSFTEVIIIGDDSNHRVRTWHWFKDGKCFKRTLCNESRL